MPTTTPSEHRYEPDLVYPPGDTLVEVLEAAEMTQAQLAVRTGLSTKHVNQIVKGVATITPETAVLLERTTGVSARTWSNLEFAYREHLLKQEEAQELSTETDWLDHLPIKEMIQRGWIRKRDNAIDTWRDVCKFFGVANRAAWEALWNKPTAFRTSKAFTSDPGAIAAWLRAGEVQAADVDCNPFDKAGLMAAIEQLRSLSREPDPDLWWPALRERCATVGVAVVGVSEVKGARVNGAARWLASDKAVVQLSLRHRFNDIFWFTFFHEIGHLLMHSKKDAFINDVGVHSGVEDEADGFAAQVLIPRRYEAELADIVTLQQAADFAERIGVADGIVVGRLQHDQRWPFNKGNNLKQRFVFVDD